MTNQQVIKILKQGGVGVIPTDTIYGLVGRALDQEAVRRIYKLKNRNQRKPCIILISSLTDLNKFKIKPDRQTLKILQQFWPGRTSIAFTKKLAFRLPNSKRLRLFIRQTGPLVATSANPESLKPAGSVAEAKKYFGQKIDFYLAGGRLTGKPSTLITIKNGKIKVIRP